MPRGHGVGAVDQHETAQRRIGAVFVEREQARAAQRDLGDLVGGDGGGLGAGEGLGVDDPVDGLHGHRGVPGRQFQPVGRVLGQLAAAEPEQAGAEHMRQDRRRGLVARQIAALDEDGLVERDADRLARFRLARAGAGRPGLDRLDPRGLVPRREDQRVADFQPAGFDAAGDDAARVEAIDVLHRQTQRQRHGGLRRHQPVERGQQRRPVMPRHLRRRLDQVLAFARGNRHHGVRRDADLPQIGRELAGLPRESGLPGKPTMSILLIATTTLWMPRSCSR